MGMGHSTPTIHQLRDSGALMKKAQAAPAQHVTAGESRDRTTETFVTKEQVGAREERWWYVSSDEDGSRHMGRSNASPVARGHAPSFSSADSSVCSSSESESDSEDEDYEQPDVPHLSYVTRQRARVLAMRGCPWPAADVSEAAQATTLHYHVAVEGSEWKLQGVSELLEEARQAGVTQRRTVVYCSSSRRVQWLASHLRRRGFNAIALCRFTKRHLTSMMQQFASEDDCVLVSCDRAAASVGECVQHTDQVPVVINYDMPKEAGLYTLRLACAGLHRAQGVTVSFSNVRGKDTKVLRAVEASYGTVLEQLPAKPCHWGSSR